MIGLMAGSLWVLWPFKEIVMVGTEKLYLGNTVPSLSGGELTASALAMLAGAALYFRYKHSDPRLRSGLIWDCMLWLSALGCLLAGGWLALTKLFPNLQQGF